jgi:hypothetical protein|tara:strand:- start:308 stop:826 length:519 start_codon:yes stop_codon:yes gene_type:complete
MTKIVVIESPFRATELSTKARNLIYARSAVKDSIFRGEIPLASHLLYTQPGILDDTDPKERKHGMLMGHHFMKFCDVAVYFDLGISSGMMQGIQKARQLGAKIDWRVTGEWDLTNVPISVVRLALKDELIVGVCRASYDEEESPLLARQLLRSQFAQRIGRSLPELPEEQIV